MQKVLNFSVVLKTPDDQKWGTLSSDNKTWNGMISELLDNKIDICSSGLSITYDRAVVSDFRYMCNEVQPHHSVLKIVLHAFIFAAYHYSMGQKPFWHFSRMAQRSIGLFTCTYFLLLHGPYALWLYCLCQWYSY